MRWFCLTANDYQKKALRTEVSFPLMTATMALAKDGRNKSRLLEGLMGLSGEAGEAIDIFKKCIFQGHSFEDEREHLAKELGDVAWYLALSASALGYSLDDILKMNLKKLEERYPNGFEATKSLNRPVTDV